MCVPNCFAEVDFFDSGVNMTWFSQNMVVEHLVEVLLHDPIASQFCITSANRALSRPCSDSEDAYDVDWWDAHNRAMFELLTTAANRYR